MCDVLRNIIKHNATVEIKEFLQLLTTYIIEIKEADFTIEETEKNEHQLDEQLDRAALKQVIIYFKYNHTENIISVLIFLSKVC